MAKMNTCSECHVNQCPSPYLICDECQKKPRCEGRVWGNGDTEDCGRIAVKAGYCARCYEHQLALAKKDLEKAEGKLKACRARLAKLEV